MICPEIDKAASDAERIDFIVAGTQKGGTSALDRYLREHAGIAMPVARKEVHFFDDEMHFRRRPDDYAPYHAKFAPRMPGQLRGEATPVYMYWEPAAQRMARYNPSLRIIVLLRNPITRAYSEWNMERQRRRETLPFLEALQAEPKRAAAAAPTQDRSRSYADRGFYTRQLQRLWRFFPTGRVLVLRSETLRADPQATLARIARFLGIAPFPTVVPRTTHAIRYDRPLTRDEWQYLASFYAAEITELERLLGWDCSPWRQPPAEG